MADIYSNGGNRWNILIIRYLCIFDVSFSLVDIFSDCQLSLLLDCCDMKITFLLVHFDWILNIKQKFEWKATESRLVLGPDLRYVKTLRVIVFWRM